MPARTTHGSLLERCHVHTGTLTLHARMQGIVVQENSRDVYVNTSGVFADYDSCNTLPVGQQVDCTREGDFFSLAVSSSDPSVVNATINTSTGIIALTFGLNVHTYPPSSVMVSIAATDSHGLTGTTSFNVSVLAVNQPPTALNNGTVEVRTRMHANTHTLLQTIYNINQPISESCHQHIAT